MKYELPFILFDPDCPLCLRFKQALEKIGPEKNIYFYSLKDTDVFSVFPELDAKLCQERIHLLTETHEILVGQEVITYLANSYPGVSKLAWLLETDVGKKALDFFYDKVEKIREELKKKDEDCGDCPKLK